MLNSRISSFNLADQIFRRGKQFVHREEKKRRRRAVLQGPSESHEQTFPKGYFISTVN